MMTLISISALQKQEVRSVASLRAVHWNVRWLSNSKGCCYHPPLCELVSSQRQGNPRCSAHFKRRALWKNNIVRMRRDPLPPPSAFWNEAERYGTEPVDKFGQTAERLHKERFVSLYKKWDDQRQKTNKLAIKVNKFICLQLIRKQAFFRCIDSFQIC